jgi:hypothetical protein
MGDPEPERSEAETKRLSDAVLLRMLNTPHRALKKKRKEAPRRPAVARP